LSGLCNARGQGNDFDLAWWRFRAAAIQGIGFPPIKLGHHRERRRTCDIGQQIVLFTPGYEMAKKKVPISIGDVIQRINQKLAAKGQVLMATRTWVRPFFFSR
jgi:hypothetical protein